MNIRKKKVILAMNDDAVLGLPMRLTVSLFIGTVALVSILSLMLNPCLFPQKIIVSVTPQVATLSGGKPENVTFTVYANTTNGQSVSGAAVIIKGLGNACGGFSDVNGKTIITIQLQLQQGVNEGYLDISVKAACHEPFEQKDMIKVVKTGR